MERDGPVEVAGLGIEVEERERVADLREAPGGGQTVHARAVRAAARDTHVDCRAETSTPIMSDRERQRREERGGMPFRFGGGGPARAARRRARPAPSAPAGR